MQYYFILGSNPSLSLAEILAKFDFTEDQCQIITGDVLLVDSDKQLDAEQVIDSLGGTIKIGRVISRLTKKSKQEIIDLLLPEMKNSDNKKISFGFSNYCRHFEVKSLAMELKTLLKEQGFPVRWVVSQEKILSSVVVEQNNLLGLGWDINLFEDSGELIIGKTLAVQPFKQLARRDFGRPARDDHSGMLPPKLAMLMINLASRGKIGALLDPFCGSGTVLMEAALLGFSNIAASDISPKAVADTKTNTEWLLRGLEADNKNFRIEELSAVELGRKFKKEEFDIIVTEPYLGPQRGPADPGIVVAELETLYQKAIREFAYVLKPGGRAVMIWPVMKTKKDRIFLSSKIVGRNLEIVDIIPAWTKKFDKIIKMTNRKTIVYGREDQKVWREIVVLEKR